MTLQDIFTSKNPKPTYLNAYSSGKPFNLTDSIGYVVSGIVGVVLLNDVDNPPTIRMLGEGTIINPELIFSPSTGSNRHYVCDSGSSTVVLVKVSVLRGMLDGKTGLDAETRMSLYKELCLELTAVSAELVETFNLTPLTVRQRSLVIFERLQELMGQPCPMTRRRFASYCFTNDLSISKIIKTLKDAKELPEYAKLLFKLS